jgi:hypothetical protein
MVDIIAEPVVIDQPSNNPETNSARKLAKQNLWTIDKAIDQGQYKPNPDDGKVPENTIIVPPGRNAV